MSKLSTEELIELWEENVGDGHGVRRMTIAGYGWAVEKAVREKVIQELGVEYERRVALSETYTGTPMFGYERYGAEAVREASERVKDGTK